MPWESLVPMTWRLTRHKWSRYSHRRRNIPLCPSPPTIIYLMMTCWRSLRSDGPTSWGSSHHRRHKPTNPETLSLSLSLPARHPCGGKKRHQDLTSEPIHRSYWPHGERYRASSPCPWTQAATETYTPRGVQVYISSLAYRRHIVKGGEATNTVTHHLQGARK